MKTSALYLFTDDLTELDIEAWKKRIDDMSHIEMARLWRFAPIGHPVFRMDSPLYEYFKERFNKFGGMTPLISKAIGWLGWNK